MKELRVKRLRKALEIAERLEVKAIKERNISLASYYFGKANTYARELRGAK